MQAQPITIVLHDQADGYEVSPQRLPLALLRRFSKDVEEFLRGDGDDAQAGALEVAIVKGSFGLRTQPLTNAGLLKDMKRLAQSQLLDGVASKRRIVMERWQRSATAARHRRIEIHAPFLMHPITISADTDFHADDADQWVRVERYVRGEIEEMGGHGISNAHIRLPDGKALTVEAPREVFRDEKTNRLYKPAMVRITAEYNVSTGAYRNARLIEFVEHDKRIDENQLERLFERGAKAWRDVPDAAEWVDKLRGSDP